MIYKPKKTQYISAFKFKGFKDEDTDENYLALLEITRVPYGILNGCTCGKSLSEHGLYKNQLICPGTYVMYEGIQVTGVMSAENFESIYEPIYSEED